MADLNGFLHYFTFHAALNHPGKNAFGAVKGLIARPNRDECLGHAVQKQNER